MDKNIFCNNERLWKSGVMSLEKLSTVENLIDGLFETLQNASLEISYFVQVLHDKIYSDGNFHSRSVVRLNLYKTFIQEK